MVRILLIVMALITIIGFISKVHNGEKYPIISDFLNSAPEPIKLENQEVIVDLPKEPIVKQKTFKTNSEVVIGDRHYTGKKIYYICNSGNKTVYQDSPCD